MNTSKISALQSCAFTQGNFIGGTFAEDNATSPPPHFNFLTRCVGLTLARRPAGGAIFRFEITLIYYFIIQNWCDIFTPMKTLFLSIAAALLGVAASASAQTWSTVTPTYGGGYQFREYSPSGN